MSPLFAQALVALDTGDVSTLQQLLTAHPALVTARVKTTEAPYDGYFAQATLLHHVAGNPMRTPLPDNIVDVARVLIEAGADVNATTGGGPNQPETSEGGLLELVTSSGHAAERGLAYPLIDLLLNAGADLNHRNGSPLWSALYHTVECKLQRDVAFYLYEKGTTVDLAYAAAVGDVERTRTFFNADGSLTDDAYACFRMPHNRLDNPSPQEILNEALVYACMNGRETTALFLLDRGAALNGFVKVAGFHITPLHGAAWAGWTALCKSLMERGADPTLMDPTYHTTAPGWAIYCKRAETIALFCQYPDRHEMITAIELGLDDRVHHLAQTMDLNDTPSWTTPGVYLRAAAAEGHVGMVQTLLEHGADPSLPNPDGKIPRDYAEHHGHTDVITLLDAQD